MDRLNAVPLPKADHEQLADWLKKEQAKVHTAMQQRFEELERAARAEAANAPAESAE